MIHGIDHMAIAADNPDALADWYAEVLGYEKTFRPNDKPLWLVTAPDGTMLEIMPKDNTKRPERTNWTPGFSHLAFRVTNLDDAIRDLDAKGVHWLADIGTAVGGGRLRNFADPEGNTLQIVER